MDIGRLREGMRSLKLAPTAYARCITISYHASVGDCVYRCVPVLLVLSVFQNTHDAYRGRSVGEGILKTRATTSEGVWLHLLAACLCELPAHIGGATICGSSAAGNHKSSPLAIAPMRKVHARNHDIDMEGRTSHALQHDCNVLLHQDSAYCR